MNIDWKKIKQIGVTIAAVLGFLLGVVNYINGQLSKVESLGGSNFTQIDVADGSVSEPSIGFYDDLDNGLYRIGTNNIGIAAGGSKIVDVGASGVTVVGSVAATSFSPSIISGVNLTSTGKSLLNSLDVNTAIALTGTLTAQGDIQGRQITATGGISAPVYNIGANQLSAIGFFSATLTDNTWIQHNLGGIPKVTCTGVQFGVFYTDSIRIGAINATSFTVRLIDPGSQNVSPDTVTVNCLAGR